jgi:hypothetical protein
MEVLPICQCHTSLKRETDFLKGNLMETDHLEDQDNDEIIIWKLM